MAKSKPLYFNWSTGKDSAMALHSLLQKKEFSVDHLLTSVNASFDRVSMHGVRRALLERQLQSLSIPSSTLELPENVDMDEYQRIIEKAVQSLVAEGFYHTGFGDIFLEDLRAYREKQLSPYSIEAHFPLWKRNTAELIHYFVDNAFEAIVVCADEEKLGENFVGTRIDKDFLSKIPKGVDPCGENGEFHTFCYAGPIFKEPISFQIGEKVRRIYPKPNAEGQELAFWFLDLF